MPSFEHGVSRVLFELLFFFKIGLLLRVILEVAGVKYLAEFTYLVLCLTLFRDIKKIKYWITSYLMGYLLAQFIVLYIFPDPVSIAIVLFAQLSLLPGSLSTLFKKLFRLLNPLE